jgi:anti-anti-sigma factor
MAPGERPYLWIRTESQPGDLIMVLQVRGEIDADSSRILDHQLRTRLTPGSRFVIVNLSEVTLLGAPGIRVLIEHSTRLARTDRRMLTVAPTPYIRRLLRISSASTLLESYRDMHSAVAACLASWTTVTRSGRHPPLSDPAG